MHKIAALLLILTGLAATALAGTGPIAPEIDPASAGAALAVVAGAVLVIRGRRKA